MENTRKDLVDKIAKMQSVYDAATTSAELKAMIKKGIEGANQKLNEFDAANKQVEETVKIQKSAQQEVAVAKAKAATQKKKAKTPAAKKAIDEKIVSPAIAKAKAAVEKTKKAKEKVIPAKKAVEKATKSLKSLVAAKPGLAEMYAGTSESELIRDAARKAMKPGKRTSAIGNTYYEKRGNRVDLTHKKAPYLKKGGAVGDDLEKELHKLQRELNSHRLLTYREGDNSEEEMARQRERASKLARFNEVLRLLNEKESNFEKGGKVGKFTKTVFFDFEDWENDFAMKPVDKIEAENFTLSDIKWVKGDKTTSDSWKAIFTSNAEMNDLEIEDAVNDELTDFGSVAFVNVEDDDSFEAGGTTEETIWLRVNGEEEPSTYADFYKENTAEGVEPLSDEDFEGIKNLEIGKGFVIGGASGGSVIRISGPDDKTGIISNRELLIDENRGVYIPNHFYNTMDFAQFGLKKEDYTDLSSPDNEFYWDAWDELLENAITKDGYTLEQDGDLWLVKNNEFESGGNIISNEIDVRTSNGIITADKITGKVISVEAHEDDNYITQIDRFDLDEYKKYHNTNEIPSSIDILDLGTYMKDGSYEGPEADWREEMKLNEFKKGGTLSGYELKPWADDDQYFLIEGVYKEKPVITVVNETGFTHSNTGTKERWYEIAVNGAIWTGSKVEYNERRKDYYVTLYNYSAKIESKLKNTYDKLSDLKQDIASVLVGETYSGFGTKFSMSVNIPGKKFRTGGNIPEEKKGGLLEPLSYKDGSPVRFGITNEDGVFKIIDNETKKSPSKNLIFKYAENYNNFTSPEEANKALRKLLIGLHEDIPEHNPAPEFYKPQSFLNKIGAMFFEDGGNIKGPKISYQKSWGPEGTVYTQSVKIDNETFQKLKNNVASEIALKHPRKDEYVSTSGYEIYLTPLRLENGTCYLNHTQTRFVNLFLKLDLKDRNTKLVVVKKYEHGGDVPPVRVIGKGERDMGPEIGDRDIVNMAKQFNSPYNGKVLGFLSTWNEGGGEFEGLPVAYFSYLDEFSPGGEYFSIAGGVVKPDGDIHMPTDAWEGIFKKEEDALRTAKKIAEDENYGADFYEKGGNLLDVRVQDILTHYIAAALWSTTNSDTGEPFDADYSREDIAPATLKAMEADVRKFLTENQQAIDESDLNDEQVGHDLWLTRNGHGAGFFDRGIDEGIEKQLTAAAKGMKEIDLEVGDDGKVHYFPEPNFKSGGTVDAGIARDRKFKSQEDHEQRYERKTTPNNPHYREAGGQVKDDDDDNSFNYMMLDRLRSDCDYFLGYGNRSERVLPRGSVDEQIKEMKRIWNNLKVKPEWLSMQEIEDYERKMKAQYAKGGNVNSYENNFFTIDDETKYPGYHIPGEYWNGWETPVFDKETALKILADFKIPFVWRGDNLWAQLDFAEGMPAEELDDYEECGPTEITLNGKKIPVYSIGAYSWIWSLANNNNEFETGGEIDDENSKIIDGVKHTVTKDNFDFSSAKQIEGKHRLGTIYAKGNYGYVASGYDWLQFVLTNENIKKLEKRADDNLDISTLVKEYNAWHGKTTDMYYGKTPNVKEFLQNNHEDHMHLLKPLVKNIRLKKVLAYHKAKKKMPPKQLAAARREDMKKIKKRKPVNQSLSKARAALNKKKK